MLTVEKAEKKCLKLHTALPAYVGTRFATGTTQRYRAAHTVWQVQNARRASAACTAAAQDLAYIAYNV